MIVGIGNYKGKKEIDVSGKIVCPGFIDSHLHLESTLVKPQELIHRAARKGTTTFIVDPHEAANVAGVKGIRYILEQTEQVQANVFVMVPSCVPSIDIEDNGAVICAEDMIPFLYNPRVLGLDEVMDCQAVIKGENKMIDKLRIFEAAMEEARAGIHVLIREGTAAKNLEAIVTGIVANNVPTEAFSFCTDDKHIAEIEQDGHIGYNVKKSISLGIDSVDAIEMAAIHAARTYGLKNLGALAPGYQADIVVLSDLQCNHVERVFFKGCEITQNENQSIVPIDPDLLHMVQFKEIDLQSLQIASHNGCMPVIELIEGEILTRACEKTLPLKNGYTIVQNGNVISTLELPVMGLITEENHETVNRILSQMIEKVHGMGVPTGINPFITLSFLALPVIPEIRITARGIYDVRKERFI